MWHQKYKEQIDYLIFGILTTLVNWLSYSLLVRGIPLAAANALSWLIAVLFAFVTNKLWVFRSRRRDLRTTFEEFWRFILARAATGLIEIIGVPLLIELGLDQALLGVEGMLSKALITLLVIVLNYIFSKWLVFRKR